MIACRKLILLYIDEKIIVKKLLILIALTLMPVANLHAQIGQYRGVPPEQVSHTYIGFITGLLPSVDTSLDENIVMYNNNMLGLLWGYQSSDYLAVEFMQKNVQISDAVYQTAVGDQNRYFVGRGMLDMRSFNLNYFIKDISKEDEDKGTRKLVFSYGVGQYKGAYDGYGKRSKTASSLERHGESGYFTRFAFGVQTQVKEVIKRGGIRSYLNLRINYYHEQVTSSDFYDAEAFNTGLINSVSGVEFMLLSTF
ncbi:MAG: hypothetical protein K0U39_04255 [Alphaproteobacteria bacterium]|nr:hypothetical protein [Alphaproteobacteria bacterium]